MPFSGHPVKTHASLCHTRTSIVSLSPQTPASDSSASVADSSDYPQQAVQLLLQDSTESVCLQSGSDLLCGFSWGIYRNICSPLIGHHGEPVSFLKLLTPAQGKAHKSCASVPEPARPGVGLKWDIALMWLRTFLLSLWLKNPDFFSLYALLSLITLCALLNSLCLNKR